MSTNRNKVFQAAKGIAYVTLLISFVFAVIFGATGMGALIATLSGRAITVGGIDAFIFSLVGAVSSLVAMFSSALVIIRISRS